MHQVRISSVYHPRQMAGECDFIVIARPGLMIIEVKGGVIGYGSQPGGGTGYYRLKSERTREALDNPFLQVDGNSAAVKKYLNDKGLRNIFVGSMVCFPECVFTMRGLGEDDLWHRDYGMPLPDMIIDSLERQIEKFRENERRKGVARMVGWKELDEDEMQRITVALEPGFDPVRYRSLIRMSIDEADRRIKEGLAILSGLNGNSRMIIQGPPGSGKSTYAFDTILRLCRDEGKKGLYICWTRLLAAEMKMRISDPDADLPEEGIRVVLYFDLVTELAKKLGDKSFLPTDELVKRGEMRQLVKGLVAKLGNSKKHEKYDFLIFDEAQDIFDKGIDFIMKVLLKVNNPIQNGSWHIFYDDSQDYPEAGDLSHYIRTRDAFRNAGASYNLTSNLRVNTGHGISELISATASGIYDAGTDYGTDVRREEWNRPEDAVRLIRQVMLKERYSGGLASERIAVLFASSLLKEGSGLQPLLEDDGEFEQMTDSNYSDPSCKTRYTTILRAKGLEWDVVVLVLSDVDDKKKMFELFIGASRAKARVYILMEASGAGIN